MQLFLSPTKICIPFHLGILGSIISLSFLRLFADSYLRRRNKVLVLWLCYLIKLKNDASSAPDVAGLAPAKLQDHLGRAVVAGGHHARVVLPVEGGRPEVDQFNPRVAHPAHRALGGGAHLGEPVTSDEQDVLRFEVCVREVVVVEKLKKTILSSILSMMA